jgi:AraC-like DNA-binding protein
MRRIKKDPGNSGVLPLPNRFTLSPRCRESLLLAPGGHLPRALREHELDVIGVSDLYRGFELVSAPGRAHHAIILTLEGEARTRTLAGEGRLQPGDLWVIPAHRPQQYWVETHWRIIWFHLRDTARWQFLRGQPIHIRPSRERERIDAAAMAFLHEAFSLDARAGQAIERLAELLVIYLDRELAPGGEWVEEDEHNALVALWREVDSSLTQPWSVGELAARLHLTPISFQRLMHRHYQATAQQMVLELRMRRARQFLLGTADTLEQIAARLGYETPFSFSRAFKRAHGLSPREFRKHEAGKATARAHPPGDDVRAVPGRRRS